MRYNEFQIEGKQMSLSPVSVYLIGLMITILALYGLFNFVEHRRKSRRRP